MKTSIKRTLAILFAFAIGMLLSAKVIAQDSQKTQQIETAIAQLQAELEQLRSPRSVSNDTTWQPSGTDPVISLPVEDNLLAPSYDSREMILVPEADLPGATQASDSGPAPASLAPSIVNHPTSQIETLPTAPMAVASGSPLTHQQPSYFAPVNIEVCPLSGRVYQQIQRSTYVRLQSVPRFPSFRDWDYLDEDRYRR